MKSTKHLLSMNSAKMKVSNFYNLIYNTIFLIANLKLEAKENREKTLKLLLIRSEGILEDIIKVNRTVK